VQSQSNSLITNNFIPPWLPALVQARQGLRIGNAELVDGMIKDGVCCCAAPTGSYVGGALIGKQQLHAQWWR